MEGELSETLLSNSNLETGARFTEPIALEVAAVQPLVEAPRSKWSIKVPRLFSLPLTLALTPALTLPLTLALTLPLTLALTPALTVALTFGGAV